MMMTLGNREKYIIWGKLIKKIFCFEICFQLYIFFGVSNCEEVGLLKMSSHCGHENVMSRLTRTWASLPLLVILIIGTTAAATVQTAAGDGQTSLHNLRLLSSSPMLTHQDMMTSSVFPVATVKSTSTGGDPPKSRKVREISRVDSGSGGVGTEDEMSSAPASSSLLGQDYPQSRQSSKVKSLYPQLSGSGELFRLFRPLALTPEKTIGMTRWYVPGFGYFNRGGRAASSNFIRFGRSGSPGGGYYGEDDGTNGGGDVSMLNRNNAKKKNNFIRLGRENPRQTNFIRLGRSGPPSPSAGEFYNSAYITPALSESFREDEDGRREMN